MRTIRAPRTTSEERSSSGASSTLTQHDAESLHLALAGAGLVCCTGATHKYSPATTSTTPIAIRVHRAASVYFGLGRGVDAVVAVVLTGAIVENTRRVCNRRHNPSELFQLR